MKTSPKNDTASLEAENAELRARLDEAEQTLEAIRLGKVDALVVSGPEGERVFTLKGADHRYRRIVEGMTEGAAIVDPRGLVLYANASLARLVATPLDRLLGSDLRKYLPPEAAGSFERLLRDAGEGAATQDTNLRAGGRLVPVHISAAADGETERGGICLVVTDLSEAMREGAERQAELAAALDEKSRLLEAALIHMPSALVAVDRQGALTVVNRRAEELWSRALLADGHAPLSAPVHDVSIGGASWQNYAFLHDGKELADQEWPITRTLQSGEEIRNLEIDMRRPNGDCLSLNISAAPLRSDGGDVVGAVAVFDDISAEKRAREALDLLVETSAALASTLEYEEILARVARLAVPRFADMCSVYMRQRDGSIARTAVFHRDPAKSELLLALGRAAPLDGATLGSPNVIETGKTELVEAASPETLARFVEDKSQLDVLRQLELQSWVGVPLTGRERAVGALYFWRTTGQRYAVGDVPLAEEIGKRASLAIENARLYRDAKATADAERRARDKAEDATRLKDEFLATLSHELRTPLNAILGWSRMLQSGAAPEARRGHAIDTIVRNASAQNQLIEDLLDVSRIVSGKLRLAVDMVDVAQVLDAAIDVVQPAADAKGVRLRRVVDPDAGFVSGDPARLQQVAWNLLSNAVKFTPRDGRVHVSLRRSESNIELAVADTGAGIAPDFLPYVFDRFRQQDGATTRRAGGLGLGLAIVKSIVELHGGTVEARSDGEMRGSTFIVKIPIAPLRLTPIAPISRRDVAAPAPSPGLSPTCPAELVGRRVLVVDDEPDARDLMKTALEHCQVVVATASSAEEALRLVVSFMPDVIVSDIGMPGQDGYTFIRKLRERRGDEGGRTPAVALTAYARAEDRRRALLEGFQNHVAKPVDPQELLFVIANLLGCAS